MDMDRCIKKEFVEQDDFPEVKPIVCNHEEMIRSVELEAHKAVQQMREYREMFRLSEAHIQRLQGEKRALECRLAQLENDRRQGETTPTCRSEDRWLFSRCDAETQTAADEVQEPPAKRHCPSVHHEQTGDLEVELPIEQLSSIVEELQPIAMSPSAAVLDQAHDRALLAPDEFPWLHGKHAVSAVYEYRAKKHLTAPTWEPPECRPQGAVLYHVAKLRLDSEVFVSDELPTIKEAKANAAMKALVTFADVWVVLNSA